ncbi:hypothetical protein HYN56_00710 [Flavobacterium crocinum]|uniref:Uncharacterized protein n=1 Tax=Flavobacterium crocinum TaxID=2183896 RepID=A0A2S1YFJ1_9FLAO|nr:hypothetical protein HYN56_00710 [Flavobacterium crocinum]
MALQKIIPKTKPCFSSSPDGSGNPFAFFFKKQKIGADSRNPCLLKMPNLSLLINILFNYE